MIPTQLSEWTLDTLRQLLITHAFETDRFDFKEKLPDSRIPPEKDRLRRTCAAFANTLGGFIIFGVADDRTLAPDDRLIGIPADVELVRDFGNFPANCRPSVRWEPRNPPLLVSRGRAIHVVHISRSETPPHAVGTDDSGWLFPKRTHKGNEWMSVEEIRTAFAAQAAPRRKLQSLSRQLVENLRNWRLQEEWRAAHPVRGMVRAIEDFLGDPLFQDEVSLDDLMAIWRHAQVIDGLIASMLAPGISTVTAAGQRRERLDQELGIVIPLTEKVVKQLDVILRRLR